jgi:hypothetical protein
VCASCFHKMDTQLILQWVLFFHCRTSLIPDSDLYCLEINWLDWWFYQQSMTLTNEYCFNQYVSHFTKLKARKVFLYKVVQIWPGQTVTCLHTNSPGHIWTTLYMYRLFLDSTSAHLFCSVTAPGRVCRLSICGIIFRVACNMIIVCFQYLPMSLNRSLVTYMLTWVASMPNYYALLQGRLQASKYFNPDLPQG